MALGIYGSWLMLGKLKELMLSAPRVDFVDFEDGLLTVRSSKPLTSEHSTIKLRASFGTLLAEVTLESYDESAEVYRLKMLDHALVLDNLEAEKRGATRLPKVMPVSSASTPGCQGTTEDISVTGTRVVTKERLQPGEVLDLKLELEGCTPATMTVQAEVCWSGRKLDDTYHSGLRFTGLTNTQILTLSGFMETQLEMERKLRGLEMLPEES